MERKVVRRVNVRVGDSIVGWRCLPRAVIEGNDGGASRESFSGGTMTSYFFALINYGSNAPQCRVMRLLWKHWRNLSKRCDLRRRNIKSPESILVVFSSWASSRCRRCPDRHGE